MFRTDQEKKTFPMNYRRLCIGDRAAGFSIAGIDCAQKRNKVYSALLITGFKPEGIKSACARE